MDSLFISIQNSLQDPYPLYSKLRKESPIVYSESLAYYFVSGYETCNSILKGAQFGHTPNDVENSYPVRDRYLSNYADKHPRMKQRSILTLNPPDHNRIRNIVSKAFTPRSIEQLKSFISNLAENLLDMDGIEEIDLIEEFAAPLPAYVIAKLMGIPEGDMPMFKQLSDQYAALVNPLSSDDEMYRALISKGKLGKYFKNILEMKKRNPEDDLLSRIVHDIENGYSITEEELLTMCSLLLVAGHETTTNLIGNGFYALMKNRDQMDILIDDRGVIKNAIEEMLRYDPPVQVVSRVSMVDDVIIEV